ncbi:MAG TPA: hypothetical protein VNI57_05165 [Candidatus Saccharimonadales bacterium]|nr:hypothetical protein [Candidatus Saccharimonadales bacterium]
MKTLPLYQMAHARSGDKGEASNVGVIAYDAAGYEILKRELTPERVKAHFGVVVRGEVKRYEVPNILALNFILGDSLGGGGSGSLRTDAQGKTHGMGLLLMEIDVPDDYAPPQAGARGNAAPPGTAPGGPGRREL